MRFTTLVLSALVGLTGLGCVRVMEDEVGVKRRLGEVQDEVLYPGVNSVNTFNTKVFRLPTRTVNLELTLGLPSKEGLTIGSEISILYRINPELAPEILRDVGPDYEQALILPVFRSASADVCARYFAKDMHSAQRSAIEQAIAARMMEVVEARGFIIEAVLMKSIALPPGLARAIEQKLEAEQVHSLATQTPHQERQHHVQDQRQQATSRTVHRRSRPRHRWQAQAQAQAHAHDPRHWRRGRRHDLALGEEDDATTLALGEEEIGI